MSQKILLFATLEDTLETSNLLKHLSYEGYNGTVFETTSLKHVLKDAEEDAPLFITLNHVLANNFEKNTTIFFLLKEKDIKIVQETIREFTHGFTTTKGCIYSLKVDSFEGSF